MSNMSYCRFRNTLQDLRDCADALRRIEDFGGQDEINELLAGADDIFEDLTDADEIEMTRSMVEEADELNLSDEERDAKDSLIALCKEIAELYDDE